MFERVLLWAVFLFIAVQSTTGTCTGRVFIGHVDVNRTVQTVYNENFDVAAFNVPIFIQILNDTSKVSCGGYTSDVTVDCKIISGSGNGYSRVSFNAKPVISPRGIDPIPDKVTFINLVPGRVVTIQCWGVSTTPNVHQFTEAKSMSPAVNFQIRPNAKVNIYTRRIVLPNEATKPVRSYMIPVELSETPNHDVKIECHQNDTGVIDPLGLEFTPVIMLAGENVTTVPFTMNKTGDPVGVYCTAATDPPSTPERQFRASNSIGITTTVMLDKASIQLTPNDITVSGTSMRAFLTLDAMTETQFLCSVRVADNYSHAEDLAMVQTCVYIPAAHTNITNITTTTTTTTTTTVPPPGVNVTTTPAPVAPPPVSGDWKVAKEIIEFKRNDDKHALVFVTRTNAVQPRGSQVVVLRCCTPPELNPDNPKYVNLSVGLILTSHIAPTREFTWNTTTLDKDAQKERTLTDPVDVSLSPCPCDMTENWCDTNCCCDKRCDEATKETFTCIPGVQGGGKPLLPPRHLCTTSYVGHPGTFPFFCVYKDNTAFLGYFYPIEAAKREKQSVISAISSRKPEYSYAPSEDADVELDNSNYKYGLSLRTVPQGRPTFTAIDHFRLALPQHTWTGQCVHTAPVQYLVDTSATCGLTMSESACVDDSRLNALTYIQAIDPSRLSLLHPLHLLSDHNSGKVVKVTVNYLCIPYNSTLTGMYEKGSAPKEVFKRYEKSLFGSYQLPMVGNVVDCRFENDTGAFVCGNGTLGDTSSSEPVLPPRCAWDNSFVRPHTPVYDSTETICRDAVVDVRYNFTWVGTTILQLNATVILADVNVFPKKPASSIPVTLNQKFEVTFVHSRQNNMTNATGETTEERSGNPGYEFGRPIITGRAVIENETLGEGYVDMNESSRISLWNPGVNSLCEAAGRLSVMFGEDTMSGCNLRLSLQELIDCDSLRMLILSRQENMMAANHISLVGNADSRKLSANWSAILRENITAVVDPDLLNKSIPVNTTTAATNASINVSDVYSELGVCENIPSGIHLDVFYADAGLFNGKSFPMIVGAKIRYTLSTWKLKCLATGGAACFDNETLHEMLQDSAMIQTFTLTSSAKFTKIPKSQPAQATLVSGVDPDQPWVCDQDHCWHEIVYPFMGTYHMHVTAAAIGLISLLFITGLITMLTPWWVKMIMVEAGE